MDRGHPPMPGVDWMDCVCVYMSVARETVLMIYGSQQK